MSPPQPSREFDLGDGRLSGALSLGLGVLSLFAVLCFRFPELLTTPELRAVYPIAWVRSTLFSALVLALGLGALSVLLGDRTVTSPRRTGLFLIGPSMPFGRRVAGLHVMPPSFDVRFMPHHVAGLGPTL